MRNSQEKLLEILDLIKPEQISHIMENGLQLEKLNLQAYATLGNESQCKVIRDRIADARLFLLILGGHLP